MAMQQEVDDWVAQAQRSKLDLSRDEDLSIALMNLISLEEHFFFTAMKTGDAKYLDMLSAVRGLRTKLLKKLVSAPEGEEWCISKHLLAASMRLLETGTKELNANKEEATAYFTAAFELYSLFFAINLKEKGANMHAKPGGNPQGIMQKWSAIVKKLVDCCKEW
ncbi:hypothetical protein HY491_00790 [Candidatus Woesearchaeota archaeon]|nr:hypothetical protein [Candidatus Woesearchaeota archaeon]